MAERMQAAGLQEGLALLSDKLSYEPIINYNELNRDLEDGLDFTK